MKMKIDNVHGYKPFVVWLTGLSGAGKTTIAKALKAFLNAEGCNIALLDGDEFRSGLCKDLKFTDADRRENIRRACEVAKIVVDSGIPVVTAFISPFQDDRNMARSVIGQERFLEVFVDTPLDECERRDPKGLYNRARNSHMVNFTGIDSRYEPPVSPDLVVSTLTCSVDEIVCSLRHAINRFN